MVNKILSYLIKAMSFTGGWQLHIKRNKLIMEWNWPHEGCQGSRETVHEYESNGTEMVIAITKISSVDNQ